MARALPGQGIGFRIAPEDVAPLDDPAWLAATEAGKRAFWKRVADLATSRYARTRERGVGANGRRLRALAERTIASRKSAMGTADRTAPPLIPAHGLSRSVSLLRSVRRDGGLWFYWADDPAGTVDGTFGQLLLIHKYGLGRVPKRDVMDLNAADRKAIRTEAGRWWQVMRRRYAPAALVEGYGWTADGPRRTFVRPTVVTTMDGSEADLRGGFYSYRPSEIPDWASGALGRFAVAVERRNAATALVPPLPPRLAPPAPAVRLAVPRPLPRVALTPGHDAKRAEAEGLLRLARPALRRELATAFRQDVAETGGMPPVARADALVRLLVQLLGQPDDAGDLARAYPHTAARLRAWLGRS